MPTTSNADTGYQGISFETMLQSTRICGILTVDSEGKVIGLTPEVERILKLSAKQTPSLPQLPSPVQSVIREAQTTGRVISERKIHLQANGSSPATATITAMPLATSHSNPCVVVVLEEIFPAKKVEQNLRRLDQLASVGTLSASMAHEIKNAFVAIRTFIDLLLEKNQDTDFCGVVRREMGRVDSIVSHMLKLATPVPPDFARVRLHDILDHSLRLVQYRIDGKKISFQRDFQAGSDCCHGNDHQLEQAFVNLMFNAVDAMSSGGTLTVKTDRLDKDNAHQLHDGTHHPEMIRVRISDTGEGISREHLDQIFEPFFTTKSSGTGLGLAVTRRIIEEHSGSIHVESSSGRGTTFVLFLPVTAG